MLSRLASRALLSATVILSLVSIASAQSWPQRWNYASNYDDEGAACAVDHFGNVFVVGKTMGVRGTYWDMQVLKYGPSGSLLWHREYHSTNGGTPYNGDTVGTSVAVDWLGNVYAAGVAYSGSTRHNDFVVWKLDSNGDKPWPLSGLYTGYDFDNGALRLSDTRDDGLDHDSILRCAIAMKNEAGLQPTFAITGPSNQDTDYVNHKTKWRTVVFEDDGSGGVQVKSGWPLDEFGGENHDTPYACAIHTDDSVYVTGGVHSGANVEQFTTVRYKPDGTEEVQPHYWVDDFNGLSESKPGHGNDIKLDYIGNAYVTGVLIGECATAEIAKEPSSGTTPDVLWTDFYAAGGIASSEGASISLSFEVVDDAIVPHAYVAGKAVPTGLGAGSRMLTIRFQEDGDEDWSDLQGDNYHDEYGLHIEAAGDGNAYVVGRWGTSAVTGYGDYVLVAFDKTGATRFSPVTYDNDGGEDVARFAVMGGAGLIYYTGGSHDGSTNYDFASLIHASTVSSYTPSSYYSPVPVPHSMDGSVEESDDYYFNVPSSSSTSTTITGYVEFYTDVEEESPTEISVTIESQVDMDHLWQLVEVYDSVNSAWITVSDMPASNGTDSTTVIVLKDAPQRFLVDGQVKVRVTHYGNTSTGYSQAGDGDVYVALFDLVRWDVLGP